MNIFLIIFLVDISLLAIIYGVGYLAVEKEQKDTWGDSKTMECNKSRKLSEKWTKKYPVLDFFQDIYYELGWKWKIPGDIKSDIIAFIQRGKKGYSRRDVWGFYCYLTDVMIDGLKDLQEMVYGYPNGIANSQAIDIDGESEGTKEWKKIIGEIIWTFEAIKKIENHDWVLVEDESKRREYQNFVKRLNRPSKDHMFSDVILPPHKWHLMTKAEMKKYHKGWELLKKYYFSLWD